MVNIESKFSIHKYPIDELTEAFLRAEAKDRS